MKGPVRSAAGTTDEELLSAFLAERSEGAFGALVERYTSLVYGVCRRSLGGREDLAQDATQAVFIVLARKAGSVRKPGALGTWLFRTANRVVTNLKREEARRRRRESAAVARASGRPSVNQRSSADWSEARKHLDDAIASLGHRQQQAIVLHYLEGRPQEEVARMLSCTQGTVSQRIAAGLGRLRRRLAARNVILSGAALDAGLLAESAVEAPAGLGSACKAAAGTSVAGGTATSATPVTLAKGTMKMMLWAKVKTAAAALLTVAVAGATTGVAVTAVSGAAEPVVEPLDEEVETYEIKPGALTWKGYGENKIVSVPDEIVGVVGLRMNPYFKPTFRLKRPARAYWVSHHHLLSGGRPPEGWMVYRQRAFRDDSTKYHGMDIYFRDFPAGEHRAVFPYRSINLGFKPIDEMEVSDMSLNVSSTSPRLVFSPREQAVLNVTLDNPSGRNRTATLDWEVVRADDETTVDRKKVTVRAPRAADTVRPVRLGRLSEGFYLCRFSLECEGRKIAGYEYPVGVFPKPEAPAGPEADFFPFGAYNKFFLSSEPEVLEVYLHAIFHSLRRHNLNTLVVNAIEASTELLDLARSYGVRIIVRVDRDLPERVMEHPAVLAFMMGDEPKLENLEPYLEKYGELKEKYPETPLVTCMVGESTGSWAENDPIPIWEALKPRLRMVRYYPMRKENNDLLRSVTYKPYNYLPPTAFFCLMGQYEKRFESPWWYVVQTFGKKATPERPDPYWRHPTGAEIRGMIHLALANGASGIVGWCLQTHESWPALIDQRTLAPEDDAYESLADVAGKVRRHARILRSIMGERFEVRWEPSELYAVGWKDETGTAYVYLINRDTADSMRGQIWLPGFELRPGNVMDIYAGEAQEVTKRGAYSAITADLAPGQGRLLRLGKMPTER